MFKFGNLASRSIVVICVVASSLGCASTATKNPKPAVVLISIDGLRPAFYRDEAGIPPYETPTLKRLASQGASANGAETIYPSSTYPSHTTMMTGMKSASHGVLSNTQFTMTEGPSRRWYWEASHVKTPTLYDEAQKQGRKTAILAWPATVGAQVEWLIPEIFSTSPLADETTWDLTRKSIKPQLLQEILEHNEEKVLNGFAQRDRWVTDASRYILRQYEPNLTLIHLINVDHVEHETGKSSPETQSAVKLIDSQIARIIEPLDLSKTTVIILGDHGFYDFDKTIHLNSLFAQQGWLKVKNGKILPDWKVISQPSGATAAIYSRDPKLTPRIVALLKKNAGQAYHVIEREELDRLGAFPGAVCAADPATFQTALGGRRVPGFSMDKEATGPLITPVGRVMGNHGTLPDTPELRTGFIAVGPGIPAGLRLDRVRLIDVAPTVAQIMGIHFPESEGKPMTLGSGPN